MSTRTWSRRDRDFINDFRWTKALSGGSRNCEDRRVTTVHGSRGAVRCSHRINVAIASSADPPHISSCGRKLVHTLGRSGLPNSRQRMSKVRCGHRTPEGFPSGSAGDTGEIEGAMQQAPHDGRQSAAESVLEELEVMPSTVLVTRLSERAYRDDAQRLVKCSARIVGQRDPCDRRAKSASRELIEQRHADADRARRRARPRWSDRRRGLASSRPWRHRPPGILDDQPTGSGRSVTTARRADQRSPARSQRGQEIDVDSMQWFVIAAIETKSSRHALRITLQLYGSLGEE